MDADLIIQELDRRFAEPLPDFYRRRIIFWYDEEEEFYDAAQEMELADAKIIFLMASNQFAVKKQLHDDKYSNYLVYCPVAVERLEDDWLLDVKLYSEEFRADLVSIWLDELGLPSTYEYRKVIKRYRSFLRNKTRRAKVSGVKQKITSPAGLHLAILAAICGIQDAAPSAILRSVLQAGLENDNKVYDALKQYDADAAFWTLVEQGTGYEDEPDFSRLAAHVLLTAATRTMRPELLSGLEAFISRPHEAFCYDLVSDWIHSRDSCTFQDVARYVEAELRLYQRFEKLTVEDLLNTECFLSINVILLKKLMDDIGNRIIEPELITKVVDQRRTCAWYDEVQNFFEGILQCANMQRFYREHAGGFHTVEPAKVWKEYTQDYYRMDTCYRLFHLAYGKCLKSYHSELHDGMGKVKDQVEGLYVTWFLGQLGTNWSDACAEDLAEHGYILDVPRQVDFYSQKVKPADTKLFVLISDALRYEVAASLAEQLQRETKSQVSLGACQGLFPTITPFGMAALLPHKELSLKERGDRLAVLVDGSTSESGDRDKLLKAANPDSVALKYSEIIGMSSTERTALIRGKRVVYIYHDAIDQASHTADSMVFPACDAAISELKDMVRIIVNEFGSTNVIITADHGFLYTYSPLTESDKVGKDSFAGKDREYGRRYAILEKGVQPDFLLPVKLLDGKTGYDAFAPRENIRIKMSGGGLNYVHGGISLQEMVVPVIEYHFLRNENKEYRRNRSRYDTKPVSVALLTANKKTSNLIFSLDFYQKEPVGGNREACTYLIYFVDGDGKKISDEQRIIADKTGSESQERTFRLTFNLRNQKYSETETYYLAIADESGLQAPERIPFEIKIAFAVDEFDFFA